MIDELIERYIELSSDRPGADEARLADSGVSVWAIIAYLRAVDGDIRRAAEDYDIPVDAVQAAINYYEQHRALIDARIAVNSVPA